ncbi:DNA adenine methylase [candidate division WOR-3 bacterium]|nr:DNA adenine methylase [candidate division WOR-3 bacterium]
MTKFRRSHNYRIGQLAKKTRLPVSTINYYINTGLIKPAEKTPSGYRLFDEKSAKTISMIKELQAEYLPLKVIKERMKARWPKHTMETDTLQLSIKGFEPITFRFPSTRYQGSKLKLVEWIWWNVGHLEFDTVLDAFGGTGAVSYLFKTKGKQVTYNDILKSNYYIGLSLIENTQEILTQEDLESLLKKQPDIKYPTFIQDTFHNIYFTDEENAWLDMVVKNIELLGNPYKRALAYFALFQACIIKRPYNLFHRKNLYIRNAHVKRSFGNKITWDTPFPVHFVRFVEEANESVFSNDEKNRALNCDVFDLDENYDLVYIDTPYISSKGIGVDYIEFYHFLEGVVDYENWGKMIDYTRKHKSLKHKKDVWTDKNKIHDAFDRLFDKFKKSILVVSYRSDGIPSDSELMTILKKHKKDVIELNKRDYKYVLSTNSSKELLFVAP